MWLLMVRFMLGLLFECGCFDVWVVLLVMRSFLLWWVGLRVCWRLMFGCMIGLLYLFFFLCVFLFLVFGFDVVVGEWGG